MIGDVGGRALHFTVRPAQSGANPPPGNYQIHPPMNDPIYGMVALMTPASGAPHPLYLQMAAPTSKFIGAPGWQYGAPAYDWIKSGMGANALAEKPIGTRPSAMQSTGFVFVLSSRPILGQNSLVVAVGFADLMDALQVAGGATVAVG